MLQARPLIQRRLVVLNIRRIHLREKLKASPNFLGNKGGDYIRVSLV
jgi:hypothetical protein